MALRELYNLSVDVKCSKRVTSEHFEKMQREMSSRKGVEMTLSDDGKSISIESTELAEMELWFSIGSVVTVVETISVNSMKIDYRRVTNARSENSM